MSCWAYYVSVPSADEAAEAITAAGGKLVYGPVQVPGPSGDRIVMATDPQGAMFALHAVAGAATEA